MQKSDCNGCEDDFYNGKNNLGVKECFRFRGKGNRVRRRFWIDYNTPTHHREAYTEVRVPSCYRRKGQHYTDSIPPYAKTPEERRKENEKKKPRCTMNHHNDDGTLIEYVGAGRPCIECPIRAECFEIFLAYRRENKS